MNASSMAWPSAPPRCGSRWLLSRQVVALGAFEAGGWLLVAVIFPVVVPHAQAV